MGWPKRDTPSVSEFLFSLGKLYYLSFLLSRVGLLLFICLCRQILFYANNYFNFVAMVKDVRRLRCLIYSLSVE